MTIKKLQTPQGDVPFDDWINRIDMRAQARVASRLDRIERGNFGDHRSVGQGVMELRVDHGPGYRIYFGRDGLEVVILLGGGSKQRQRADIKQAQRNWKKYKQERHHARRAVQDK